MAKLFSSFILIFLLCFYAYGYEKVYFEDEENSLRYMIRDYNFIRGYNQLWQAACDSTNIALYDDFINKDFSQIPPKKAREEAINFIINYQVNIDFGNNGMLLRYPLTNILVIQNRALLKARKILNELPIHEKTSLVYLAAGISYIKSDGLYELEKLQKIFKEWLRLGGDDFKHISQSQIWTALQMQGKNLLILLCKIIITNFFLKKGILIYLTLKNIFQ